MNALAPYLTASLAFGERVLAAFATPLGPTIASLLVAFLMLALERRGAARFGTLLPPVVLAPLALMVARTPSDPSIWAPLLVGLVIAALARNRRDLLHSECGIKLLWLMVPALALSWAGGTLLTIATGTPVVVEQWGVLQLGLDPPFLWKTALPLTLLAGLVLLGAAPFHFWLSDLIQGARPWLGPLAAAAFQGLGAAWIAARLTGIEAFPSGSELAGAMLRIGAGVAFLAGVVSLFGQRRPERRVGTLASLQGGLVLATLAASHGHPEYADASRAMLASWSTHLVLALTGASVLARFLPVSAGPVAPGAALFRRHPLSALLGAISLLSLSGVPGTPGARVWLQAAQTLAAAGHSGVLVTLAMAWLAAFGTSVQVLREGFGVPTPEPAIDHATPWQARAALWITGIALIATGVAWWRGA